MSGTEEAVGDKLAVSSLIADSREHISLFRWGLLQEGYEVRVLLGRKMRQKSGLFDECAAALQFPSYFGENWSAFNDCLSDLEWLHPKRGYVIVIMQPAEVLADGDPQDLEALVDCLRRAQREFTHPDYWKDERDPTSFRVVLADEAKEIESAGAAWTTAGAAVGDLDPVMQFLLRTYAAQAGD